MMFGSYPYPGNIIENNTIEFINVYVKPGKPPKFAAGVKASECADANRMWICRSRSGSYPEDVKREGDHPRRFPEKAAGAAGRNPYLPGGGIFPGEIVLDPFVGTGTTCAIAKTMGRRYVIDINRPTSK